MGFIIGTIACAVHTVSVAVLSAVRQCSLSNRTQSLKQLSVVSGGGSTCVYRVNSARSLNDGSTTSAGCERAPRRASAVHTAALPRRTRPVLQQSERRIQKQENERTSPGVSRLSNMFDQLDSREQRHGE